MHFDHRISLLELSETAGPLSVSDVAAMVGVVPGSARERRRRSAETVAVPRQSLCADEVWLDRHGAVHLPPGVVPRVGELGRLLERLLADIRETQQARFPPGLILIAARATGRIDLAPVPSCEALAAALTRFAPPDAEAALKALYQKANRLRAPDRSSPTDDPLVPWAAGPHVVDEFEYRPPLATLDGAAPEPRSPEGRPRRRLRVRMAAAAALALMIGFGAVLLFRPHAVDVRIVDATDVLVQPSPSAARLRERSKPRPARGERAPAATSPVARAAASRRQMDRPQPLVDATVAGSDKAFSPSFAANGTAVFFHAETETGTALKRAEAGQRGVLHVVTNLDDTAKNYHVQLSPDGTSVPFDSDRDGVRGVYVARADGTGVGRGWRLVEFVQPIQQRGSRSRQNPHNLSAHREARQRHDFAPGR